MLLNRHRKLYTDPDKKGGTVKDDQLSKGKPEAFPEGSPKKAEAKAPVKPSKDDTKS